MSPPRELPPNVAPGDRVVLYDGVCKLCGAWAVFLIRFDRKHIFKLATIQSSEGKALLQWFGLPTEHYETMVLVEGPRCFTQSTAFLRVVGRLPFPCWLAGVSWIVPRLLRDWFYDRIAQNRYAIFGKRETCLLPTPDHAQRFLGADGR